MFTSMENEAIISFNPLERQAIRALTRTRPGEKKLGQTLNTRPQAKFQILGIPESLGVRANYGIAGTETAWPAFLQAFLNLQENRFLSGEDIHIAGEFAFKFPETTAVEVLRKQVEEIDQAVSKKIEEIVLAGQIPIVIGGGHNNAYPILKGLSLALQQRVNTLNLDVHADFRPLEGRHSGNGFSYAYREGYLHKYHVIGLKKTYAPEAMLEDLGRAGAKAIFLDELGDQASQTHAILSTLQEIKTGAFGVEIDLDGIENMLSSAVNPYGLPLPMAHRLVQEAAPHLRYLHLCEGASTRSDGRTCPDLGKVLAELVATLVIYCKA